MWTSAQTQVTSSVGFLLTSKNPPAAAGDMGSVPDWEDPEEEWHHPVIPTREPCRGTGRPQSIGSQKEQAGHHWATKHNNNMQVCN